MHIDLPYCYLIKDDESVNIFLILAFAEFFGTFVWYFFYCQWTGNLGANSLIYVVSLFFTMFFTKKNVGMHLSPCVKNCCRRMSTMTSWCVLFGKNIFRSAITDLRYSLEPKKIIVDPILKNSSPSHYETVLLQKSLCKRHAITSQIWCKKKLKNDTFHTSRITVLRRMTSYSRVLYDT